MKPTTETTKPRDVAIVGDCAIITSANLNDNPRNEDFRLSWHPAVVEGLRKLHRNA